MSPAPRPLSPHLQVYRWTLPMTMSILHRATGIALSLGTILLVLWLVAAASGPVPYGHVQGFIGSWIGLLLLFGWSVSLFYHLCNGIRHLWWDTGQGLELPAVYGSGWVVLAATAVLTVLAWVVGLLHWTH
ncbi:MAG: succinate dehydrogenase, cytochrome b556 subunit [Alphaproteobacteria bacterium]|nr:succinate dehydrogenase, cytochrome b556 subunit [Alphaproteobacteria bacterium]